MCLLIKSSDAARAAASGDFVSWIYTEGQQFAVQEDYSELSAPLLAAVRKKADDVDQHSIAWKMARNRIKIPCAIAALTAWRAPCKIRGASPKRISLEVPYRVKRAG